MQTTKASNRYAQALFEIAIENSILDEVMGDLKLISGTIQDEIDLIDLIKNPTINKSTKKTIFEKIFIKKVNKSTMNFLSLVIGKNREAYLLDMINKYQDLYNEHYNIVVAHIISAEPMDEALKNKIKAKINIGGSVHIEEKIDKSLLGGFIIKTGDLQYDASIRKKIKNAKRAFKL
jgi:F-type H+-transporting ATPase subunit delta